MAPTPDELTNEIQTLRLTCDRLRQQIQLQASFLGMASHELRAPINQVISLHQLVLEDLCEGPEEEREFIAQANQAIHRVLKNLDTLISLSKLDIGAVQPKRQAVELWMILPLVQQFTEMKCINRHCRLTVAEVAEDLAVQGDMHWLQQMLITLVEAALAAESTVIELAAMPAERANYVTITLGCDASLERWPLSLADASADRSAELPDNGPMPSAPDFAPPDAEILTARFSPALGYHLAGPLTRAQIPGLNQLVGAAASSETSSVPQKSHRTSSPTRPACRDRIRSRPPGSWGSSSARTSP